MFCSSVMICLEISCSGAGGLGFGDWVCTHGGGAGSDVVAIVWGVTVVDCGSISDLLRSLTIVVYVTIISSPFSSFGSSVL